MVDTEYWNMNTTMRLAGMLAVVGIAQLAFADDVAKYDSNMRVDDSSASITNGVKWIDGKLLPIEGRAFDDTEHYYDRLPAAVSTNINEGVRAMKHNTSGMQFRFRTDSSTLRLRWIPYDAYLETDSMPSTGKSGLDVYRFDEKSGRWLYVKTGRIWDGKKGNTLTVPWRPGEACLVHLPLFNGVREFALGVDTNATVAALGPRKSGISKPVVFYGTSITHGGSASRPGMAFVNIVGRDLDVPVVGLGFAGSGIMELEMSELVAKIDASCYVLDCLWNMTSDPSAKKHHAVQRNYEPFIRNLRALRPDVPIIMAEACDVNCGEPGPKDRYIKSIYDKLIAEGWKKLIYLPKTGMFSGDTEGTVDGCHPNDLGMRTIATTFDKAVAAALGLKQPIGNSDELVRPTWKVAMKAVEKCDSGKRVDDSSATVSNDIKWIDGKLLPIEGRAFNDTEDYYDRLPKVVSTNVNIGVRGMKHHTSGMMFRFRTDSSALRFRWKPYFKDMLSMDNMSPTGASGIDVYRFDAKAGKWKYVNTGRISDAEKGGELTIPWRRDEACLVNLPLYNGLREFTLGIETNATVAALGPRMSGVEKPVVFYGTSVTHGGCASRSGLGFVNIVGRDLDVPVVGLGFSGCGWMEFEMSDILAEIDASCYVLDCLGNMFSDPTAKNARSVERNYEPFIRNLRAKRPNVPIVMAEGRNVYGNERCAKDDYVRSLYEKLVAEGWKNLVLLPTAHMFSGDLEGTVDGTHPNDLGMFTVSAAFGQAVFEALNPELKHSTFGVHVGEMARQRKVSVVLDARREFAAPQSSSANGVAQVKDVDFSRHVFHAGERAPRLVYDAYRPIEAGSEAAIAIVLIHGWGGHVRTLLPVFTKALRNRAGSDAKTPYVIAPQFPRRLTMVENGEADDGRAVWCDSWADEDKHPTQMGSAVDDWRGGGDANGTNYSSYDYIDAIFSRFADRRTYPNLRKVVLAGFSAGGQFAGRYAATGRGVVRDGVAVVYVAMSPSTEFRFEKDVPWLYGLKGRPRYSATLTDADIMKNLTSRRVWRGCGSADDLGWPKTSLDITPPAVAQGANRFARFRSFEKYLDRYPDWKRQVSFHVFEGIGHNEDRCYPAPALLDFIFE